MKENDLGRWTLVGPGAVGLYYGGRIAGPTRKLSVLARSDADTLANEGIRIAMVNPKNAKILDSIEAPLEYVTREAHTMAPTDCVIIAAKSTVNEALVESLKSIVEPGHTVLLCLQNGMGNAEFFAKHFPENPILSGLCFVCVNRTAPGYVENYHPGRVEVGSLGDRWPQAAQAVVDAFNHAGVVTSHAEQLDAALWRKLCWNVPFNGLSIAAGGITTDKILADPDLIQRARVLMEEVRAVAVLAGHRISDKFIAGQFSVTEKMGAYKPSSLIDYLARKPVELESIWGEPLRRGHALGAQMPELQKLYDELKQLLSTH
ncbi:2-dehydropantoate 2-reductase [Coraliomargarita sp. SDUM461003]|uniref:2-dehydropantoate 2-reductase n=1 Tax=Thalassobacterium maritimum TaxID=3041265 RepID=A0ABU1ASV8_9BACT|nr:2-dehydropantoate 2-reductase [Coraliomargarita sp. SDUM461003]MDQ8206702.1 2-dehydropantoate 2-reductase [Coraliomargarita sp. SDUM461003]